MKIHPKLKIDYKSIKKSDLIKIYKSTFKKLQVEHLGEENPTHFFIKSNHQDEAGQPIILLVLGKQNPDWKKHAKTECKTDKKNAMLGQCYVEMEEGEPVLQLIPARGNIKPAVIRKSTKTLLPKLGFAAIRLARKRKVKRQDLLASEEEINQVEKGIEMLNTYKLHMANYKAKVGTTNEALKSKLKDRTAGKAEIEACDYLITELKQMSQVYANMPQKAKAHYQDWQETAIPKRIQTYEQAKEKIRRLMAKIKVARELKAAKEELNKGYEEIEQLVGNLQELLSSITN
ncbi:MAG: hypothetical protein MK212_06260 [Saprospiraceae bacterium]|nr:hypothetical protein [Saprospiraceae bacterium]